MKRMAMAKQNSLDDYQPDLDDGDDDFEDTPDQSGTYKVHILWEGHKILRNLHQLFVLCTATQMIGGDFVKFCGLLRKCELYRFKKSNYR